MRDVCSLTMSTVCSGLQSGRRSGSSFCGHTSYQLSQRHLDEDCSSQSYGNVCLQHSPGLLGAGCAYRCFCIFLHPVALHPSKERGWCHEVLRGSRHTIHIFIIWIFLYSEIIWDVCSFCISLGYEVVSLCHLYFVMIVFINRNTLIRTDFTSCRKFSCVVFPILFLPR